MKKALVISIFIVGLGIFFYPMISNILSTKVHESVVEDYSDTVKSMDEAQIKKEKEKADLHNKELEDSQLDFVDPFSEDAEADKRRGNQSYYDALNIGPAIGSVEIPKMNMKLPIYHGTSEEVLSKGVGHLENSSLPTGKAGTHSVLTAHRGLPSAELFRHLDSLTYGDQFYVQVLDETMAYEVFKIDIVLPHETDWLQMREDKDIVTLLTCDPYMINSHRLLVTGKRVPYHPDEKQTVENTGLPIYVYVLATLILLSTIYLWYRRKKKAGTHDEA
ncbi:class C sortase [Siminovitchia terrae]|uniref:Class C sortase n=1 Tax=Siminovitchia terrae TaxID=1914933 RepID=A0A429X6Y7_SIMTE|nr:class C sortase [Siminovitchia terrae]RST59132.1 class C sortase [Siminovitchia terrae]